jgi:hypothetical protein
VIHRHQIGSREFTRVSELSYVDRRPVVVITWLHFDESLVPGVCVQLDPARLRKGPGRRILRYDGTTVDPRYRLL